MYVGVVGFVVRAKSRREAIKNPRTVKTYQNGKIEEKKTETVPKFKLAE